MKAMSWSYPIERLVEGEKSSKTENSIIAVGGCRSYGDSNFRFGGHSMSVSSSEMSLHTKDQILRVSSGATILEVINFLGLRGFELYIFPGTAYATIGGCIAADVHGKNSHKYDAFSNKIISITLKTDSDVIFLQDKNLELWRTTVGGNGLTGIILECEIEVRRARSRYLDSKIEMIDGLTNLFKKMKESAKDYDYAVAWLDGRKPTQFSKGFVHFANESNDFSTNLTMKASRNLIPNSFPYVRVINPITIMVYNYFTILTRKRKAKRSVWRISKRNYFFPLMDLGNWNKLFGRKGFHELQFFVPFEEETRAQEIMNYIIQHQPVFLIGIKLVQCQSNGYLSFAGYGWSIALDFRANKRSEEFIKKCHSLITEISDARVYLTKDWVLEKENFEKMYPYAEKFRNARDRLGLRNIFSSEMSKRLDL